MSDIQTVKSHVVANLSSLLRIYCEQEEQCRTSCKQLSYPNHWLCYAYIYLSGDQSISLRVPSEEEDDNIDDNFYGVFIDKSVELCCPFRISDRCVASGLIIIVLLLAPICGWKRGSLFFARGAEDVIQQPSHLQVYDIFIVQALAAGRAVSISAR